MRSFVFGTILLAAGCFASGCADLPAAPAEQVCTTITLRADEPNVGDERYLCFSFQPSVISGSFLRSVEVTVPLDGPVLHHHVSILADPSSSDDGSCEQIASTAIGIHRGIPGGEWITLPEDVALELPHDIERIVVQAHVLRVKDGPAEETSIRFCSPSEKPIHSARWLPLLAPVPAIRPNHQETSTSVHVVSEPIYVFSSWPHMHRIGAEFHSTVITSDGTRQPLLDVVPFSVESQRIHRIERMVSAGESIETTCIWQNPTPEYVFPGPGIDNEMCNQGLVVWSAGAGADAR
jgi:hypothetical protein